MKLGVEYDYSIGAETARFRAYGLDVETIHVVSFGGEVTGDTDPRLDPSEHDAFAWSSYGEAEAMLDWPVEQDALEPRRRALRTVASLAEPGANGLHAPSGEGLLWGT